MGRGKRKENIRLGKDKWVKKKGKGMGKSKRSEMIKIFRILDLCSIFDVLDSKNISWDPELLGFI